MGPALVLSLLFYVSCIVNIRTPRMYGELYILAWRRIHWYVLVLFLTYAPLCAQKLLHDVYGAEKAKVPDSLFLTLNMLNGFFNAIVFSKDDRCFRRIDEETQA